MKNETIEEVEIMKKVYVFFINSSVIKCLYNKFFKLNTSNNFFLWGFSSVNNARPTKKSITVDNHNKRINGGFQAA